jgi:subtilisin family serine protease
MWTTGRRCLRRVLPAAFAGAAIVLAGPPAAAGAQPSSPPPAKQAALTAAPFGSYVPGEILVEFGSAVGRGELRVIAGDIGGRLARRLPATELSGGRELVVVRSTELSTDELLAAYAADPRVTRLSRNYYRRACEVTPNDPRYGELWGLPQILAPAAWTATTGGAGLVVAGIDSGVDYLHPDLAANMWHNPGEIAGNGIDDDANGYIDDVYGIDAATGSGNPYDSDGHGSHTAGTTAAVGNNGIGVTGVAWSAQIMALKFITNGNGTEADEITCLNYAINEKLKHGVNVVAVNASFGGSSANALEYDAIARAGAAGIVVCAAAGNGGNDSVGDDNDASPFYPASYDLPNVIAVAATDKSDALTRFSNYGLASVDLGAPGLGILSTWPAGAYQMLNGTSMATPLVTGAVALCAALHPEESAAQRATRIIAGVAPVAALAGKVASGGRLDLQAALNGSAAMDDDDIPGVALPASPFIGLVDACSDAHDVYAIRLQTAHAVRFTVRGPAGTNFGLRLFSPDSTTLDGGRVVAVATGDAYPDRFTYVPPRTGTYYLDVVALSGGGRYTVSYQFDTVGPVYKAKSASVVSGRICRLDYFVGDSLSPKATTVLRILTRDGKVKKTFRWGLRTVNVWRFTAWRCPLPRGTYGIVVTGRDLAGNPQSVSGSATLRVQ